MNKILISYNKNTQDTNTYKYRLTLLTLDSKNKCFAHISNTDDNNNNNNISKFSSLLCEMGVVENDVVITSLNDDTKLFEIIGIVPQYKNDENYFRTISTVISKIISKISNLKSDKNEVVFDISNYSSEFQHLLLTCLEYQNYSFNKYIVDLQLVKEENKVEDKARLEIITTLDQTSISNIQTTITQTSYCRNLVNSNACEITSEYLHNELEEFSKKHNLEFKAIVGEELVKENMNLHYQVGKSAQTPPRMLYATYKGNPKTEVFTALVGKGITFDTGGINLKPTGAVEDMKLDMAGAATTLSAFKALVEMKIEKNIVLVLGCAENSIDSLSYKPGDVFISRRGISVEITNTDAEGRLVLADCMDYVQEKFNVEELIDCATLTGASMIALGLESIAMFSNDNAMARRIYQSSKDAYELMWRLPIFEEHREVLKSTIANCSNAGSGAMRRYGGASSAAAFLEKFVKEDVKWVHLDIAGSSFSSKRGASGAGVRTLVEYLK
ncbi:MAG: leucyl aminopeptidase family protein [Nanoarchaeota archaeon]|nr:leucyl aminopeptidase family protein [Nanoarchaeota archaeon]